MAPGYRGFGDYPFPCRLEPKSMCNALIAVWETMQAKQFDFRAYAEKHHNVEDTVRQCLNIYSRYL